MDKMYPAELKQISSRGHGASQASFYMGDHNFVILPKHCAKAGRSPLLERKDYINVSGSTSLHGSPVAQRRDYFSEYKQKYASMADIGQPDLESSLTSSANYDLIVDSLLERYRANDAKKKVISSYEASRSSNGLHQTITRDLPEQDYNNSTTNELCHDNAPALTETKGLSPYELLGHSVLDTERDPEPKYESNCSITLRKGVEITAVGIVGQGKLKKGYSDKSVDEKRGSSHLTEGRTSVDENFLSKYGSFPGNKDKRVSKLTVDKEDKNESIISALTGNEDQENICKAGSLDRTKAKDHASITSQDTKTDNKDSPTGLVCQSARRRSCEYEPVHDFTKSDPIKYTEGSDSQCSGSDDAIKRSMKTSASMGSLTLNSDGAIEGNIQLSDPSRRLSSNELIYKYLRKSSKLGEEGDRLKARKPPSGIRQSPRTAALLSNPRIQKHLARQLCKTDGEGESKTSVKSHMAENRQRRYHSLTGPIRAFNFESASSEKGSAHLVTAKDSESEARKKFDLKSPVDKDSDKISDGTTFSNLNASLSGKQISSVSGQEANMDEPASPGKGSPPVPPLDLRQLTRGSVSCDNSPCTTPRMRTKSRFHVPSFKEFKQMQRGGMSLMSKSLSFSDSLRSPDEDGENDFLSISHPSLHRRTKSDHRIDKRKNENDKDDAEGEENMQKKKLSRTVFETSVSDEGELTLEQLNISGEKHKKSVLGKKSSPDQNEPNVDLSHSSKHNKNSKSRQKEDELDVLEPGTRKPTEKCHRHRKETHNRRPKSEVPLAPLQEERNQSASRIRGGTPKNSRRVLSDVCERKDSITEALGNTERISKPRTRKIGQCHIDGTVVRRSQRIRERSKSHSVKHGSIHVDEQQDLSDAAYVMRSTSDVSDMVAEDKRTKTNREKRHKAYKSDPFDKTERRDSQEFDEMELPGSIPEKDSSHLYILAERRRRCSVQSSKEDILNFLKDVKTTGLGHLDSDSPSLGSLDSYYEDDTTSEDTISGASLERGDSGVGEEKRLQDQGLRCEDCDKTIQSIELDEGSVEDACLCRKCGSRRVERKEALQEIVDTEVSYGKDLKIIKEEFMIPMQTAGLLNSEQLQVIFSNLEELVDINDVFAEKMLDALDQAMDEGDEDYTQVNIGTLFLESTNMLLAFENYCTKQAAAPLLLEQLEREKELLRVFLQVSQTENSVLRRMNLKSFLMVPVQRVMKYPLLLARLHKLTPANHMDKEPLKQAQGKIESILEHINAQTKGASIPMSMRLRRRGSGKKIIGFENFEINKIAIEALGWNRHDVNFVITGKMMYAPVTDHTFVAKRGKNLKFVLGHGLLVTLGKSTAYDINSDNMLFYRPTPVKQAAFVMLKDKGGKYALLREPFLLNHCIISVDPDYDEVFEVQDINKEAYLFKSEDPQQTMVWCRHLKCQAKDLGTWRKRRNALANIMIQTKT